jgi:hypothetical protein
MALQHLNQWCGNVVMVTLYGLVFMLPTQDSLVKDTAANKYILTIHTISIPTSFTFISDLELNSSFPLPGSDPTGADHQPNPTNLH